MQTRIGISSIILFLIWLILGCTSEITPGITPENTPEIPVDMMPEKSPVLPAYSTIPGVYLGTFHGVKSSSISLFENIGKGVAISAAYTNFSSAFPNGFVQGNAYVGRISFLTWEFMPGSSQKLEGYEGRVLEAITDGHYDDVLNSWADGMRAFGKPVFLRFGHEMNGDWYPWSGVKNGGGQLDGYGSPDLADGPERYVDAFRYIHETFTAHGAENVLWVWCPNAPFEVMENALGPWNQAAAYYPGDDYVDWLCFDGYNWGSSAFGQQFNAQWLSFSEIFASSYAELVAINPDKPIIIGEFASTEDGGDKAAWITDAFDAIRHDYPQIRALIWFHIAKETDWRINSSDAALGAYREAVADDYWMDTYPGMMP
jgi:beta-mannanase